MRFTGERRVCGICDDSLVLHTRPRRPPVSSASAKRVARPNIDNAISACGNAIMRLSEMKELETGSQLTALVNAHHIRATTDRKEPWMVLFQLRDPSPPL